MQAQTEPRRATTLSPRAAPVEPYNNLTISDRNRIIGSPTDALIVKRGRARVPIERRVMILWRDEGSYDLPRRGRENGSVRPYVP
jgi:hypothetical protein